MFCVFIKFEHYKEKFEHYKIVDFKGFFRFLSLKSNYIILYCSKCSVVPCVLEKLHSSTIGTYTCRGGHAITELEKWFFSKMVGTIEQYGTFLINQRLTLFCGFVLFCDFQNISLHIQNF